eukprot:3939464-Amphidinium_carterae.1
MSSVPAADEEAEPAGGGVDEEHFGEAVDAEGLKWRAQRREPFVVVEEGKVFVVVKYQHETLSNQVSFTTTDASRSISGKRGSGQACTHASQYHTATQWLCCARPRPLCLEPVNAASPVLYAMAGESLNDFANRLPLLLTPSTPLQVPHGHSYSSVAIRDDVISQHMSNLTDGQIEVGKSVAKLHHAREEWGMISSDTDICLYAAIQ